MKNVQKPEKLIENHLIFLDRLRESGKTNMFGASHWLARAFQEISEKEAREILTYWMNTFSDRHAPE